MDKATNYSVALAVGATAGTILAGIWVRGEMFWWTFGHGLIFSVISIFLANVYANNQDA